jgi:succinate dehydrogenase / fumarate reductase membrane anchor subunit
MKGVSHWLWQRYTAVALVPLAAWLWCVTVDVVSHHKSLRLALSTTCSSVALILLAVTALFHGMIGMEMVIQDYVPNRTARMVSSLTMKTASFITGLVAVLVGVRLFVVS